MAPLAAEPRQLLVVLNTARRQALYMLVREITAWQRAQLELKRSDDPDTAPLFVSSASSASRDSSGSVDDARNAATGPSQRAGTAPSPELIRLRRDALAHFDKWRDEALAKLKEIVSTPDDAKIVDARKKRTAETARRRADGGSLIDFGDAQVGHAARSPAEENALAVERLQALYHAIPTRLTSIAAEDREETLSCVLLLLLSTGNYSAYSRALMVYLASALELPLAVVIREETEIAKSLVEASANASKQGNTAAMSAEAEAQKRKQDNQSSRYWKVGLASVAGAAIIGVTGGLAAPVVAGAIGGIMGSVGLGGVASFLGIFWMNGALVGTLFGAYGARMTGNMVDQYAKEVEDFRFLPLKDEWGSQYKKDDKDARRLKVTIGINGWLTSKEDVTRPWRVLSDESEVFALRYEMNSLLALGNSLRDLVSSQAWGLVKSEILRRTVLASLWSALWPAYLVSMASSIDNPFSLAKNRSEKAGQILADALINKVQGERPVTLVGYSLGSRVIYACLRSLVQRRAFGLIDSVVFIGAPVPSNRTHWQMMRSVVSGQMFNVYSENDSILAFMYRATSMQLGIAGLQEIKDIEGVENLNLSEEVKGHLRYPDLIAQILTQCGFPDIKEGDEPISKDEDPAEIRLHDSDRSKMGQLIDFEDLNISDVQPPPTPPRPTPASATESADKPPLRNSITQRDSKGLTPSEYRAGEIRGAAHPSPSMLEDSRLDLSKQLSESSNTKYHSSTRDLALGSAERAITQPVHAPPPAATTAAKTVGDDTSDVPSEPESDEDYRIVLEDNDDFDDMVTYSEPTPIED